MSNSSRVFSQSPNQKSERNKSNKQKKEGKTRGVSIERSKEGTIEKEDPTA